MYSPSFWWFLTDEAGRFACLRLICQVIDKLLQLHQISTVSIVTRSHVTLVTYDGLIKINGSSPFSNR